MGNLLPKNQRQRRTCYALCHILHPVSAAHTSIFRMDSISTTYMQVSKQTQWDRPDGYESDSETVHPNPCTLNLEPQTPIPYPQIPNPYTLNPQPPTPLPNTRTSWVRYKRRARQEAAEGGTASTRRKRGPGRSALIPRPKLISPTPHRLIPKPGIQTLIPRP